MKKLLLTSLLLSAGLASAQTNDNWMASGSPVRSGTGLCWRDANWTPATAHPDCDGAIKKVVPVRVAEAPAQKVDITKPSSTIAARAPIEPSVTKVSYSADALFDFDKAVLKADGKVALNALVGKVSGINLEVIIVVGHTDSVGSDAYNQRLGERRANAVKAYLVSMGVNAQKVRTESKGEKQPIADNKTREGRAKNRRVEIEVVGTLKK